MEDIEEVKAYCRQKITEYEMEAEAHRGQFSICDGFNAMAKALKDLQAKLTSK